MAGTPRNTGSGLGGVFLDGYTRFPKRPALKIEAETWSYEELAALVGQGVAALAGGAPGAVSLGAVFASRSRTAYQGVLSTLLSGAGYVPLNPAFPTARNLAMLNASGAPTVFVGRECLDKSEALLAGSDHPLKVVLPQSARNAAWEKHFPQHRFVWQDQFDSLPKTVAAPAVSPDDIAYLLFTSGTTGTPKGVMVAHRNVQHHLAVMRERYGLGCEDRFTQTFDLTFDLSVFDLFMAWGVGGCLLPVPQKQLMAPDGFVKREQPTVWFSVPSTAMVMKTLRQLKPGAYPSIRWSLFCGERLPADVAAAWQSAAPSSIVENLYGPTEATIACTLYRWDPERSPAASQDGVVPIGRAYPGMQTAVVDDQLRRLPAGQRGELLVAGPQVALGYWKDEEKTAQRFVAMPSEPGTRWYRTGDLAYVDPAGDLIHCGRLDDQLKIHGYRIELGEVEAAIREASGSALVSAVGWPRNEHGPTGITAFVSGSTVPAEQVLALARARLPSYMVPQKIMPIDSLPLNANGKIDKKQLLVLLEGENAQRR